ncbi:DUF1330 domain-containing protein [Mesorhizobium sp. VK4C]|uniref:DUF1330 domain-containing protein n=1 Tax=Mesorhizobium captivum TaxID=3072319 RepID=UPI002A23D4F2|nr:DUF1330 domain-containing protein [Mesorhizobium sp. VK4C]MDX8498631.1 DUF1330 domain-containing protein [Mesorhizobium sp. VK4C]
MPDGIVPDLDKRPIPIVADEPATTRRREYFTVKGYWLIVGTEISDQEAQAGYARLWKPIGEKYQARSNPMKEPPLLVEARDAGRVVVVEFPSLEIAKACYNDPAYDEARRFALQASNRVLLIFEGNLGEPE